ncbi:hypothetical protein BD309DRAFT_950072 [Dichomitus squalens]|nr:hypothetical protein BD309DRAFT_950072 [Dichomitus squalens]
MNPVISCRRPSKPYDKKMERRRLAWLCQPASINRSLVVTRRISRTAVLCNQSLQKLRSRRNRRDTSA